MKIEDFRISHLRQIRWSALNFFRMFASNFNNTLKSLKYKFLMLKLYIYCKKVGKKTQKADSRRILQFLLVPFRETYCGVPPIFRTLILVHLKEIGLSMKIFLGS